MLSGLGAALAGCADARLPGGLPTAGAAGRGAYGFGALKPLDLAAENLIKITVCTRPFRAAGPRLDMETVGGKRVLHHYGHGGAGWSLAWGYADAARERVIAEQPSSVVVLGAGAIGLTTAIALAETGLAVTIIARETPMETRSARATGVWSPSSRIGFATGVDADFPQRWAALARRSYARHLRYVGRAGDPVEFTPRFSLRTETREAPLVAAPIISPGPSAPTISSGPLAPTISAGPLAPTISAGPLAPTISSGPTARGVGDDFLHLDRLLRGLTPAWTDRETPFPGMSRVRGGLVMTFNIAEYTRQMTEDFLTLGGRIERGEIASASELARLPGDVVVNCTGYDAKALLGDPSLIPVRGQIAWMAPQTDRLYGIFHRHVMVLSRRDGLLIQETGGNDYYGLGDDSEIPDDSEFRAARAKVAPVFNWG